MKTPEQIAAEAIDGNLHLMRPFSRASVTRLIEAAVEADWEQQLIAWQEAQK